MKKSQLVQIIKEALTDKVKAVTVSVDKLQKGDTMAADKAKVTSIKKDGDNFEITLSGGKKLTYKKGKQVQIVRAGSTLEKNEKKVVKEGLLNSFSDYDTVFEMARHKAIPFAAVGILLVKYGIAKAKELIKGGKEEVMDAIEDSPKEEPSTMPTKRPIKLFKNKKDTNENYEEADDEFDTGGYVEAMGPELDKHIKAIAGIFQEWENGPATEPEMVGYAMYDLIEYIKKTIRR